MSRLGPLEKDWGDSYLQQGCSWNILKCMVAKSTSIFYKTGHLHTKMSKEMNTTTAEYWTGLWKERDTGWHREEVNEYLIKYVDEVTGRRWNVHVFVPLCGKSYM